MVYRFPVTLLIYNEDYYEDDCILQYNRIHVGG